MGMTSSRPMPIIAVRTVRLSTCIWVREPVMVDRGVVRSMAPYPWIRATSSMTSISVALSGLKLGILTSRSSPAGSGANSMEPSKSAMRSRLRSVPSILLTRSVRTRTGSRCGISPRSSTMPGARVAPLSPSSWAKRRIARSATSGSAPFSKRADASLRSPNLRADVAIDMGSHQAISRATDVVPSWISVDAPPITPAMPMAASSASATTPSAAVRVRSMPSRVKIVSPSTALRTRNADPATRSRS